MTTSVKLGRIAGVTVGFNWSLLVIGALFATGLATGRFPIDAPGYSGADYAVAGAATAFVFLAGVLAHELSHAVVARREGIEVDGITLWVLGGLTRMASDPTTPGAELRISGAGPLTSLVLGLTLGGTGILFATRGESRLVAAALVWLGVVNILLAVFNVLPGAPLDGGRLLHAFLWSRHGDRLGATETASRAGQVLGAAFVGLGLVEFAFGAGLGAGLWLALVGGFLIAAAYGERERAETEDALDGVRVRDVMTPDPVVSPAWISARDFVDGYVAGRPHGAYPVEDRDGHLLGMLTGRRLRAIPDARRASARVIDIACPLVGVAVLGPDQPAATFFHRLGPEADGPALVVEGDRLVGILTEADLQRSRRDADLQRVHGR